MWFIDVEVEQETSAPPPKKSPVSAPDWYNINSWDLKCKSVYDVVLSFLNVEGTLGKIHPNKKDTERYVFLLDGLLICCKQVLCSLF